MLRSVEGLVDGAAVVVPCVATDDAAAGLGRSGEGDGLCPVGLSPSASDVRRPALPLGVEGPGVDARVGRLSSCCPARRSSADVDPHAHHVHG